MEIRPQNRASWVALAISYHLLKNYGLTLRAIDGYLSSLSSSDPHDFEHSEMLLYKAFVLEDSGDLTGALAFLNDIEPEVCDKLGLKEARARCLHGLGYSSAAEQVYLDLLSVNSENRKYYDGLQQCRGLATGVHGPFTEHQRSQLLNLYAELRTKLPKAHCAMRLPLDIAQGEEFTKLVDAYLRKWLMKGAPSLFSNLRSLYEDKQGVKPQIIERLVGDYLRAARSSDRKVSDGESADSIDSPSTVLWILYFLAQHYCKIGNHAKAISLIDEAIAHTPTLLELYYFKGKIMKLAGDCTTAASLVSQARELDTADRWINTKATKYLLRDDRIEEAEKMISLFSKSDAQPTTNLVEMQCSWFMIESGRAHLRRGELGSAIKKFQTVDKFFADMIDDQFDFHTYCVRKMTIRAYMALLKMEDGLQGHRVYVRSAVAAIECYLRLYDHPEERERASTSFVVIPSQANC